MSLSRASAALPKHRAMSLSPWLIVGSALILALAIAFWAVKNTRQERETMTRALLERAGALMWAMEGGARAGMGLQRTAFYLQYMLEETARQQGIAYMAVITRQGDIVAHSDRQRVSARLYAPEQLESLAFSTDVNWRVRKDADGKRIFEAFRLFTPLPGFRGHMGHDSGHPRRGHMMAGRKHGMRGGMNAGAGRIMPPDAAMPPGAFAVPPPPSPESGAARQRAAAVENRDNDLIIVVGLNMADFDRALTAAERNTLFTALLVGLLGVGGFLSLFWAQNYRLSRRMLLDARAFSEEVISSLPLGLVIFDAEGRVTHVNGVAEKLLRRKADQLVGLEPLEVYGRDWADVAERVGRGQSVLEEEHTLAVASVGGGAEGGAAVPVSISASRILNEKSEPIGMIYLLRDLREVKRLQAELRRRERLSTLGNMAARVAHEIRNPLSSIKGFATYLGARSREDADKEAARTMIGEVERLNRVVSELLDFARPSSLSLAPTDLDAIADRAARLAEADAGAKGVRLARKEPEGRGPVLAAVDAERITQALLNLLLNAVQATQPGGSVTLAVEQPEGGRAAITVADTGRGMAPEVLSQVFSPYFTTRATGTGLGLSIVAKIIEDHQGEIAMQSQPGQGTTVTVWLPLAGPEAAEPGHPEPAGQEHGGKGGNDA